MKNQRDTPLLKRIREMRKKGWKDGKIIAQLLQTGVSKYRIQKLVEVHPGFVYRVARRIGLYEDGKPSLHPGVMSVREDGKQYVTIRWIAYHIGLTYSHVSDDFRKRIEANGQPVNMIVRRMETRFRRPVRLFALDEVWPLFPEWHQLFELRHQLSFEVDSAERARYPDLNDRHYLVLCTLLEWWRTYQYWPTIEDLMTSEGIQHLGKDIYGIRSVIEQLIEKGYLTKQRFGYRSIRYIVHKGPRRYVSHLIHCPKCQHVFREPWPFFQPKQPKV